VVFHGISLVPPVFHFAALESLFRAIGGEVYTPTLFGLS
jgi:hypothetical protein